MTHCSFEENKNEDKIGGNIASTTSEEIIEIKKQLSS